MFERTFLIVLGVVVASFEILFGAISGLDLLFVGIFLSMGGVVHYYQGDWRLGISAACAGIICYFLLIRPYARKQLLLFLQKWGFDCLVGKLGIVASVSFGDKKGSILLDGELWDIVSTKSLTVGNQAVVTDCTGQLLHVATEIL